MASHFHFSHSLFKHYLQFLTGMCSIQKVFLSKSDFLALQKKVLLEIFLFLQSFYGEFHWKPLAKKVSKPTCKSLKIVCFRDFCLTGNDFSIIPTHRATFALIQSISSGNSTMVNKGLVIQQNGLFRVNRKTSHQDFFILRSIRLVIFLILMLLFIYYPHELI